LCNNAATQATASGARKYTPSNVDACIGALHDAYSKPPITLSTIQSMNDKCDRIFSGAADKGQPCTANADCTNSRVCSPVVPGSTQSICADKTAKNAGDFCSDPGSVCPADTYCAKQMSGAYQCSPAAQPGQSCSDTIPCVSSQRCKDGICQSRAAPREAC